MKKIIDWIDKHEKKIETGMLVTCGIIFLYIMYHAVMMFV